MEKHMIKNLFGKSRPKENPYAIYKLGDWEWRVLKTYQRKDKEDTNQYSRWFVAVRTPMTHGGWDMGDIEPEGLPAVKLDPLLRMVNRKNLSDEDMVNFQKRNLLDIKSPNPSVETFLHAFLPHKFVDHTHADAILDITNRPDGLKQCRKIFGSV